jgi:DNA-binding protein YbaB
VVKAVVSGKMRLDSLTIDPEAVSPDDVEMLQDLVLAAVNEGMEKAQEMASTRMSALTGGLNIPGLI